MWATVQRVRLGGSVGFDDLAQRLDAELARTMADDAEATRCWWAADLSTRSVLAADLWADEGAQPRGRADAAQRRAAMLDRLDAAVMVAQAMTLTPTAAASWGMSCDGPDAVGAWALVLPVPAAGAVRDAELAAIAQRAGASGGHLVAEQGASDGWAALTWPAGEAPVVVGPRRSRRSGTGSDGCWLRVLCDRMQRIDVLDLTSAGQSAAVPSGAAAPMAEASRVR